MHRACIEDRLLEYLREMSGNRSLHLQTQLLEEGIVDSLTMMDILVFIETHFETRLDFADINPRSFQSPATLAALIADRAPAETASGPRPSLQIAAE